MADTQTFSFDRHPESVPEARATLDRFEGALSADQLYDAALCMSELITNAVQHPTHGTPGRIELELALTEELLRVQVVDTGGGFVPAEPTRGEERGWGLFIVDQLSTRWGVTPGQRTAIWFEIERRPEDVGEAVAASSA